MIASSIQSSMIFCQLLEMTKKVCVNETKIKAIIIPNHKPNNPNWKINAKV